MLYFPNTRVAVSSELPVAVGATILAEGSALVANNAGGVFGAAPSAGSSGENFIGVSVSQQMPLLSFPQVEANVQPASNTISLRFTPQAGTIFVYDTTAGAALVVTTNYTVSGNIVTLQSATLGHVITVSYKFVPTVVQARSIMGDVYPGGAAGLTINQIGIQRSGSIYTTEFDSTVNWNVAAPVVKTGAGGVFTIGGSGATVNCAVIQIPNTASPYLGLLLI